MCKTFFIFTADGKEEEIETVGELEKHLGIDATPHLLPYYNELLRDGCLCQIDVDALLLAQQGYERTGFDWRQVRLPPVILKPTITSVAQLFGRDNRRKKRKENRIKKHKPR